MDRCSDFSVWVDFPFKKITSKTIYFLHSVTRCTISKERQRYVLITPSIIDTWTIGVERQW